MSDHRKEVYDLLKVLPYNVYLERVDAWKADMYPLINVCYSEIDMNLKSHDFGFDNDYKVLVTIAHNGTTSESSQKVYDIRREVLSTLLRNSEWRSQNFETLDKIKTTFGILKGPIKNEGLGEADLHICNIEFNFSDFEKWDPVFPNNYEIAHVGIDLITPTDLNNGPLGPDGRPEAVLDITLPL